ncbi:MAG TPA: hypothetical protein VGL02_04405 [Streptomyces sp.]
MLLTVFRETRQRETAEIERAQQAQHDEDSPRGGSSGGNSSAA